jgi:ribonuclease J
MLRIVPLGGLGEIGLNCMAVQMGDDIVVIDAGVMFPSSDMPGVGWLLPDFSYLAERPLSVKAILLTHGHEDHIGALADLLRRCPAPVYGTPLTLALAKARLDEAEMTADFRQIGPREPFAVGEAFSIEPLQVAHSVPEALGFLLKTPAGQLLHTGDFKLDASPVDGRTTDAERLARAGDEGIDCLLSDSTNAEVEEDTGSENEVAATFERLFAGARGRVVVAMFASHLQRLLHAIPLCIRLGRMVALAGRSMVRNVQLAQEAGYLPRWEGAFVTMEEAQQLAPEKVALFATGAQAEPRSALVQMLDASSEWSIGPGDLVVLSARAIPGNERAIAELIDSLASRGARVVHSGIEPNVHVSGHASRGQQKQLMEWVRPKNFVPIHGHVRQLLAHLSVARAAGLPENNLLLATDGDCLQLQQGRLSREGKVAYGRRLIDRYTGSELGPTTLAEREKMAQVGLVVVIAAMPSGRARPGRVEVTGRGLSDAETSLFPACREQCEKNLAELSTLLLSDDALVREALVRGVRQVYRQSWAKRPAVLPFIINV